MANNLRYKASNYLDSIIQSNPRSKRSKELDAVIDVLERAVEVFLAPGRHRMALINRHDTSAEEFVEMLRKIMINPTNARSKVLNVYEILPELLIPDNGNLPVDLRAFNASKLKLTEAQKSHYAQLTEDLKDRYIPRATGVSDDFGGSGVKNSWLKHVAKVRKANPSLSYKECLMKAKLSYK